MELDRFLSHKIIFLIKLKIKKPLIPKTGREDCMYLPAVPPTLVLSTLASFILNAENGKHYCYSCLQLLGEFMMYPVDSHQPSTL
jgi:hypothetical protein